MLEVLLAVPLLVMGITRTGLKGQERKESSAEKAGRLMDRHANCRVYYAPAPTKVYIMQC